MTTNSRWLQETGQTYRILNASKPSAANDFESFVSHSDLHKAHLTYDFDHGSEGVYIQKNRFGHTGLVSAEEFALMKEKEMQTHSESIQEAIERTVGKSFRCVLRAGTNTDGTAERHIEFSLTGDPNDNEDLYLGLKEMAEMMLSPDVENPDFF